MSLMSRQSTIESPDSVSLVTPPRMTAPKHIPAHPTSQEPTIFWAWADTSTELEAVAALLNAAAHVLDDCVNKDGLKVFPLALFRGL